MTKGCYFFYHLRFLVFLSIFVIYSTVLLPCFWVYTIYVSKAKSQDLAIMVVPKMHIIENTDTMTPFTYTQTMTMTSKVPPGEQRV